MTYFFREDILYNCTVPNLKVKFTVTEIVKRIFEKETLKKKTIFGEFLHIFKIGNKEIVENIFPGKISHDL